MSTVVNIRLTDGSRFCRADGEEGSAAKEQERSHAKERANGMKLNASYLALGGSYVEQRNLDLNSWMISTLW